MPTSVSPAASAVLTASAVGAETAISRPVPAITAFCTMSTETRLVMTMAPSAGLRPACAHGADQLVERIVPADILAHASHALARPVEPGGMHRAGFGAQLLVHRQRAHRLAHVISADGECHVLATGQGTERLLDGFDATQPAAHRSRHLAAPRGERRLDIVIELHLHVKALIGLDNLDGDNVIGRPNDGLRQRKSDAEIVQVSRRRHHHGLRGAAKRTAPRGLPRAAPGCRVFATPALTAMREALAVPDGASAIRAFPFRAYSAGSSAASAAMRRDLCGLRLVVLLPDRRAVGWRHLYRGHLCIPGSFVAPVGEIGGDHIGLGAGGWWKVV